LSKGGAECQPKHPILDILIEHDEEGKDLEINILSKALKFVV
jgi:hypothetical protein